MRFLSSVWSGTRRRLKAIFAVGLADWLPAAESDYPGVGQQVIVEGDARKVATNGRVLLVHSALFRPAVMVLLTERAVLPDTRISLTSCGCCWHANVHYCIRWSRGYRITALLI